MKTGTLSTGAQAAVARAKALALEIDELLRLAAAEEATSPVGTSYSIRVVQGVARSLVDQLDELRPGRTDVLASTRPSSDKKIHAA